MLVGWTDRPLGGAGVNGSAPQRRDLTLIGTPLSVHFPARGAFRLLSGTIGSQLVDMLPRAPQSSCCSFGFGRDAQQDATVGNGGFLTFEFDLPTGGNVRFQRLGVSVSSRDNGVNTGHVYDWRARQWVKVDLLSGDTQLPDPNRFVSPQGRVMLRLDSGGDLDITDPYHDVEISGAGSAS